MKKRWQIGKIIGVEVWFRLNSLLLSGLLWLIFSVTAVIWLNFSLGQAVIVGGTAVLLHWLSDLGHHLGHALAARRTGYPMQKIISWYVLMTSVYPKDEPPVHATIHIQRALGGPIASLLLAIIAGILLLVIPAKRTVASALASFAFWENFLVLFLGAFVPLGFTDGSTLLTWWPRRHEPI
ncbi:hypothetical protein [Candidatus Leptofilum sp.]|uniref:hypothetical protein n=1 Tax=Candidatus Leptofilum sp. TaxID=3241576 RepID=UPI003B5CF63A